MAIDLSGLSLAELRQEAALAAAERQGVEASQGGVDIFGREVEWAIQRMMASKNPPMGGPPGDYWYWRER